MNTSTQRIYERLRKQSLRARRYPLEATKVGENFDWRQWGIFPSQIWTEGNHAAFVAGVRAALQAVEADTNAAYEAGLTDGFNLALEEPLAG